MGDTRWGGERNRCVTENGIMDGVESWEGEEFFHNSLIGGMVVCGVIYQPKHCLHTYYILVDTIVMPHSEKDGQ